MDADLHIALAADRQRTLLAAARAADGTRIRRPRPRPRRRF
jgi:hypothetical protein